MLKRILFLLLLCMVVGSADRVGQADETSSAMRAASVEERRILAELREARQLLQEREQKVAQREMELKTLREEVDKKLADLKERRAELAQMLAEKDETEIRKAKELGKMYEKMDPLKAAEVIASLEKDLAVAILEGMRGKSAGKILEEMERETAADLTVSYSSLAE